MKLTSYWLDTASRFAGATQGPVEGAFDVAVIGGGFCGLSAARRLAQGGASVVLLEAGEVGAAASGRNGGHLNNGVAHSWAAAKAALGERRARALYHAFDASIGTIETIAREEEIDCAFRRSGKLKLASKPAHFESIAKNFKALHREIDPDTQLLSRAELKGEIGSDAFHGGLLMKKSAMMHMGRFGAGLATAAMRRGARIYENAAVTGLRVENGRHVATTARGQVSAREVFIATGATTTANFGWFRRRIVPVGSFIVATRPLTGAEIASTMPGDRTYVTSLNIGNYFRLSPDRRLLWGGRARFTPVSNAQSDEKSGAILRASLAETFPQLKDVEIDYCWGGLVDMTQDRFPRAGRHEGAWYALGFSGHGAQLAPHMGVVMADAILGRANANPLDGLDWPAVPGHFGRAWFLPLVGMYYKALDRWR